MTKVNYKGTGVYKEFSYKEKPCDFCKNIFKPNSSRASTCSNICRKERIKKNKKDYYKRHAKKIYKRNLKYLPQRLSRQKAMRLYKKLGIDKCEQCGNDYRCQVHHIDFNPFNNDRKNLIMLCNKCHTKAHSNPS